MKKKHIIISLIAIVLVVTGYISYPHIQRELYLRNNSHLEGLSESEYFEGRSLLRSRAKTEQLVNFIKDYERYKINQLLESDYYKDARNFYKQSTLYYDEDKIASDIFLKYEVINFDNLKSEYITNKLEWSYDIEDIYVPKEYTTTWDKDFFGEWHSHTYQSGGGYSYSDFIGAYLYLAVENNFIFLDIKGDVIISAKEKTSAGDVVAGGLGALGWGLIAGLATEIFGGSTDESNDAFMAGAALGSQELWDKERNTTVSNIIVKANKISRQSGKVSLRGKQFEENNTPKIKRCDWSVYDNDINIKFSEFEMENMIQADLTKIFSLSQIYFRKPKDFGGGGASFYGFVIPADFKNKLYTSYENRILNEQCMKIVCRSNKKFTNYDNNLIFVITPDSLYFGDNANNFLSKVSERRKEELIKNNSLVGESARSDTKTIKEKVRKNEFISESDKNKINSDNYEEVPPPPPPVFEEEEEEEPIYFIAVEKMPEPIGGISAIQKKVVYPELAKRAGVQGRVYVKAFVDNNGIVRKVEIIKGIGAGCDEAAMKAVQDTKFNPGQQRGRNVNVQVNIPIIFGLK